jgi:hypothetical protein
MRELLREFGFLHPRLVWMLAVRGTLVVSLPVDDHEPPRPRAELEPPPKRRHLRLVR